MVKAARESATRRLPHLETRALDSKEAANPRTRPGLSGAIFLLIECSGTHLHGRFYSGHSIFRPPEVGCLRLKHSRSNSSMTR